MRERVDYARVKHIYHLFCCPTESPTSGSVSWADLKCEGVYIVSKKRGGELNSVACVKRKFFYYLML